MIISAELLGIQLVEAERWIRKTDHESNQGAHKRAWLHSWRRHFPFADCAFAEASNYGDKVAVAVQVSINFLRPTVEGDTLTAEATRISDGKTFGVYSITVRKEEKTIALFNGLAYKQ